MGIFGKIVDTAAKKVIIETVGDVTTKVAVSTIEAISRNPIQGVPSVRVPAASSEYIGVNCMDARNQLEAYGFSDIVLLPHQDLIKGWLIKDGAIEQITINGKENFKKNAKFAPNAKVVITFHTFRDKK